MLFYFTGTGNSLYAAKALAQKDEELVNIAEAVTKGKFSFRIPKGENAGFVFPVYFYTLPDIVADFCSKLRIKGGKYVYAVITCGGGTGGSGAMLKKLLKERGIHLDNTYKLIMPDNAVFFYDIKSSEKNEECLSKADKLLDDIKQQISECKKGKTGSVHFLGMWNAMYSLNRSTKKFYSDNSCVGCGLCARNCPEKAIIMKEGKPRWVKKNCSKCSACINRCPSKAIQYGKGTVKRGRYVNPVLKSK